MQIVRQSSFKTTPWKNGGGTTHEALRVPPEESRFRWRVSVAHIDVSGPFSDFAGYNRKMVLLRGAGVRLTFGNGHQTVLRNVGELIEFGGALAADCELLDGPCTDLNLIVSDSMENARVWVERVSEPRALETGRDTLLVFPLSEMVSLEDENGTTTSLEPWDLAVIAPGDGVVIGPPMAGVQEQRGAAAQNDAAQRAAVHNAAGQHHPPPAAPLVFFATLRDNLP